VTVDTRAHPLALPPQFSITKDSVSIHINAVITYKISDPVKATLKVQNIKTAINLLAQTTVRAVTSEFTLDQLLQKRQDVSIIIQRALAAFTSDWGLTITNVEVRDVELNDDMKRVMGLQAEAERGRRSRIIAAEGELQASSLLANAATTLEETGEQAYHLRFLQTITAAAHTGSKTVLGMPWPFDFDEMMAGDREPLNPQTQS